MTYNTDVAHCVGQGCPLRDCCKRYWLYLEWEKIPDKTVSTAPFIAPQYDEDEENCLMFSGKT